MTTNTTLTTLQAARQYIRCRKALHLMASGIDTIIDHLTDPYQIEQANALYDAAKDHAQAECDRSLRQYDVSIQTLRQHHGAMQRLTHLFNLDDIAEQYAWK